MRQDDLPYQIRTGILVITILFAGCAVRSVVEKPANPGGEILEAIHRLGKHGDWLVIRGIHHTDNFVSTVTNMPLSHAALLDTEHNRVIEAEGSGVHTGSLEEFVAKSFRLMLIRPVWANETTAQEAVAKAREYIGKKYDFSGLVGLNISDRYYCTELVVSVYQPYSNTPNPIPPVIAPGQLYHWGTILYDSGPNFADFSPYGSEELKK
jgi:hypothetical protein